MTKTRYAALGRSRHLLDCQITARNVQKPRGHFSHPHRPSSTPAKGLGLIGRYFGGVPVSVQTKVAVPSEPSSLHRELDHYRTAGFRRR